MSYVSFGWVGENREIKVVLKKGVLMTVHYADGQPDQHAIKTYGKNELPTPWTKETGKETVVRELAARNPHAKIG